MQQSKGSTTQMHARIKLQPKLQAEKVNSRDLFPRGAKGQPGGAWLGKWCSNQWSPNAIFSIIYLVLIDLSRESRQTELKIVGYIKMPKGTQFWNNTNSTWLMLLAKAYLLDYEL